MTRLAQATEQRVDLAARPAVAERRERLTPFVTRSAVDQAGRRRLEGLAAIVLAWSRLEYAGRGLS